MPTLTKERIGQFVKTAFQVLAENDGHLAAREVLRLAEPRLNLNDFEKEALPSGAIRWENCLNWYTVDSVKAGWLVKRNGIWYLTDEGRNALSLDPVAFFNAADQKYKEAMRAKRAALASTTEAPPEQIEERTISEEASVSRSISFEKALSLARTEIENYINALGPYEFQDLVAALLRGMGYHTPFVAPPGKDGGLDIVAYRDPLGGTVPRFRVQVKHREQKVTAKEVRELIGLLSKEGDAGLIVSSGGFTADAAMEIQRSPKQIEKLDLEALITMWEQHYDQMKEEDRAYMPLRRIAFLAPEEA